MGARHDTSPWDFPNAATPPGSTVYYGIRLAPYRLRDDLAYLHGWRYEVQGVLDQVTDPGVAAAKLDWWRAELERLFAGRASHPLAQRLTPLVERDRLPPEPFLEVIEACASELALRYPADQADWIADAERDLGSIAELIVRCHGRFESSDLAAARRVGTFCALVERLRDSGWRIRRGRLGILPTEQLASAGLSPQTLSRPEARERLPGLLAEASEEVSRLDTADNEDIARLPITLRAQRRVRRVLLEELRASGFDVLDQRIALTPIRKLWHAWQESHRA